ncbi:MAG: hypothetical protein CENE_00496 [Candidatus Celerinatantimonas neptuna]|nr:MAG: hypothetical protein CENE_00496 [Candidatus Celerinatantimonas neptuna]
MSYPLLYGQHFFPLQEIEHGQRLHPDAASAYIAMRTNAAQQGISIALYSSYRSFHTQCVIWNEKWNGQRLLLDDHEQALDSNKLSDYEKMIAILRWSALPGASRHHWGTDMDLFTPQYLKKDDIFQLIPQSYKEQGNQAKLFRWLKKNARKFNFFFPYRNDFGGTHPEPWHLSFGPLAKQFQRQHSLDGLRNTIISSDIAGKNVILEHLDDIYTHYFYQTDQFI